MDISIENTEAGEKRIANGVLGIVFVIATAGMFFAGLISAYVVNRSKIGEWPPAGQPRLPVAVTGINTLILIGSAIFLFLFMQKYRKNPSFQVQKKWLLLAVAGGAAFLAIQGTEWVKLIHFGLSSHGSIYGGFFYLIIGAHALHVTVGMAMLLYLFRSIRPNDIQGNFNRINMCSLYWFFVTGIWPLLYYLVYLS